MNAVNLDPGPLHPVCPSAFVREACVFVHKTALIASGKGVSCAKGTRIPGPLGFLGRLIVAKTESNGDRQHIGS